jgi:hypothetical protein
MIVPEIVIVPILGLGITEVEIDAPKIRPIKANTGIEVSQRSNLVLNFTSTIFAFPIYYYSTIIKNIIPMYNWRLFVTGIKRVGDGKTL